MESRQQDRLGLQTWKFGLHAAGPCEETDRRNDTDDCIVADDAATGDAHADGIESIDEADTGIANTDAAEGDTNLAHDDADAFTRYRRAAITLA